MILDYEVRGGAAGNAVAADDGWNSRREKLQRRVDDFAK
jgi:hypothetical protein